MRVGKVLHTHTRTQWAAVVRVRLGAKIFHAHRVCCTWMLQANYAGIDTPNAAVARCSSRSGYNSSCELPDGGATVRLLVAAVADSRPIKTRIRKVAIARGQDLKSERETFYNIHADFRYADQSFEQRIGAVYLNHQAFVSACKLFLHRG